MNLSFRSLCTHEGLPILFHVVFCLLLFVIYLLAAAEQLPRLGKRELICLLSFTFNYVFLLGEVSSSSGCLGWAALFYCGPP